MSSAPTIGFGLAIIAAIGILFAVISNEWKVTSQLASQDSFNQLVAKEGLWKRCTVPQPGLLYCDNYSTTLFDVPALLQLLRGLMLISALSIVSSVILDCLAMDCITVVTGKRKLWIARGGGICAIFAGILCLIAVSWYAADVIIEFNATYLQREELKYTFGAALYVGWVASGMALLSGAIVACCTCSYDDEDDMPKSYAYKSPKATSHTTEYV